MNDGKAAAFSIIEKVAHRDRLAATAGLAAVAVAGLWVTLRSGDALMLPTAPAPGTFAHLGLLFLMWWAMMMAMMLPTAAPAILAFGALAAKWRGKGAKTAPLAVFAAGYAAIWTFFSLAAAVLQTVTRGLVPLTGMMAVTSAALGGVLLVGAGIYQFTPLKDACLRQCQSPLMFFMRNWRAGPAGAFHMGLHHGWLCLGCCWALMGLLLYGGVMELRWITGLAAYVLIEKLTPAQWRVSRYTGGLLVAWGAFELWRALS